MNKLDPNYRYRGIIGLNNFPIYYINIPKSACTTIKNLLYFIDNKYFLQDPLTIHEGIRTGKFLITSRSNEYFYERFNQRKFIFSFVREPLQRAYSCFNEKILSNGPYSFALVRNYLLKNGYIDQNIFNKNNISIDEYRSAFLGFLKFASDNINGLTDLPRDSHWGLQSKSFINYSRSINIDFVGRVSSFKTDFEYVLEKIEYNNSEKLSELRFNEGPAPKFSLKELMNDEITNIARNIYKRDYDFFGNF
jgi:hypothetical protein